MEQDKPINWSEQVTCPFCGVKMARREAVYDKITRQFFCSVRHLMLEADRKLARMKGGTKGRYFFGC